MEDRRRHFAGGADPGGGGFFWYVSDYYRAEDVALEMLSAGDNIEVRDNLTILSPSYPTDTAVIFYPGAKVEAIAYLPLLDQLLHQCLWKKEQITPGTGGQGGGVIRPVVEQRRRAEQIARLQHAHDELPLVHLHPARQHHRQAAAEPVGRVDDRPPFRPLPPAASVRQRKHEGLFRRAPKQEGPRQQRPQCLLHGRAPFLSQMIQFSLSQTFKMSTASIHSFSEKGPICVQKHSMGRKRRELTMVKRNDQRALERARAQAAAQAIIAQGRRLQPEQAAAPALEEEPMNRYRNPLQERPAGPVFLPPYPCGSDAQTQACLERILETLVCQNQLLVDLLGAVNSLTAATLSVRDRG